MGNYLYPSNIKSKHIGRQRRSTARICQTGNQFLYGFLFKCCKRRQQGASRPYYWRIGTCSGEYS